MSKVVLFLCALPLISVIAYMISRPALFEAGLILTASVLVTSGIIYLGVYKDSFVSKIEQPSKAINGTAEELPFEFLESDIASFQQCLFLLTKLRKQLLSGKSKDILIRRLFESGIQDKLVQVFDVCDSENDERLYRAVALLEAIFCEAPEDLPFIKSDSSFPAFLRCLVNIQRKWQHENSTIVDESTMRLQLSINRALTAIAAKWPQHRRLLGDFKALTLVFDGSLRRHVLSDEKVILWALRFLTVMTAQHHTVNKAEVYRMQAIPTLTDLIGTYKQYNRDIVFYSLVLLGQLLESSPDSRYSIAQARQECAMSNILESLIIAEQTFRSDAQFAGQVKEVSQLIFTNFS